jgi:hypothetical protein
MKTITIKFIDGTTERFEHCQFSEVSDGILKIIQLINDPIKTLRFKANRDTIERIYILKNIVGYTIEREIEYENELEMFEDMGLIKRT